MRYLNLSILLIALGSKALAANPEIIETSSAFPPPERGFPLIQEFPTLPAKVSSGFGTVQINQTLNRTQQTKNAVVPACGPSTKTNTLSCFNIIGGVLLNELPVPGTVTTVPLYVENGWLFGTNKGVFVRTQGLSATSTMVMGGAHIDFWGSFARVKTEKLRPQTQYEGSTGAPKVTTPIGWIWHHTSASEFIGKPVLLDNFVYVLSANQYLHALDYETGKLVWAYKLAPDTSLRMTSVSLAVTSSEVVVGTSEGFLTALNSKTGTVNWKHQLPTNDDRFPGIVALPLVSDKSLIVSNAESITQRISLETHAVEWSHSLGSVAQVQTDGKKAFIGGKNGNLVAVDARSGAQVWKSTLSSSSPIASIYVGKNGYLLVALNNGSIILVRSENGAIVQTLPAVGETAGEFFSGGSESRACLSFVNAGFRCYAIATTKADF